MPILEVDGLVKSYGSRRVVDGVSFSVDFAEIVGLLGPNGAGKTTSFRMTCGMIEPDKGTVVLNGIDVTRWPMYRRAKEGHMGYLAQESSVFRKLTVEQNLLGVMELLDMQPYAKSRSRREHCDKLLEQFGITKVRKSKAGSLSGGERRRLEIARCLVSEPEIILLDEPFTGIDPVTIESIQTIIKGLKAQGISILITDHQVRETLEITDRSYVVHQGRVLVHGSREQVLSDPKARELYFGTGISAPNMPLPLGEAGRRPGEGAPLSPSPPLSRPSVTPAPKVSLPPPPAVPPPVVARSPDRVTHTSLHDADTLRLED